MPLTLPFFDVLPDKRQNIQIGSATLLEAVNNAIDELRADGTLKELSEKYFGQDISSEN